MMHFRCFEKKKLQGHTFKGMKYFIAPNFEAAISIVDDGSVDLTKIECLGIDGEYYIISDPNFIPLKFKGKVL